MEIKVIVTHTASPELLAVLGGLVGKSGSNGTPVKNSLPKNQSTVSSSVDGKGEITITEIRELATKLSKDDGKGDKVKGLLKEFNTKAITGLTVDQYSDFHTKLKAL